MRVKTVLSVLPYTIESHEKDIVYRVYVTDALEIIAYNLAKVYGGKTMSRRFLDIIKPKQEDNRTAEEIIKEVITRAGLKIGGDGK